MGSYSVEYYFTVTWAGREYKAALKSPNIVSAMVTLGLPRGAIRRGADGFLPWWSGRDAAEAEQPKAPKRSLKAMHEQSHIPMLRESIREQYRGRPGSGSFGEILCYEIHTGGLTFCRLAEKWGVSLPVLGELIWDHCKRLEEMPRVDHDYRGAP